MGRMAQLVVPGAPHHVTQRGNRRQATFFGEGDYLAWLALAVAAEAFAAARMSLKGGHTRVCGPTRVCPPVARGFPRGRPR